MREPVFLLVYSHLYLTKLDAAILGIHSVDNCQRFQVISKITDNLTTGLEALFDSDANPFYRCTCLLYNLNQTLQCTSIGQEIINNQNTVLFIQDFLDTITWFLFLCVKDSTSAVYISPSRLMLLDFFAKTTGTPNSIATTAAIPIQEASMVRILLIFLPSKRRYHSLPISLNSAISI